MSVVGTAGHVDHGKSTLLVALTGRDPDRWEEEKRRGLTIDLGFVWATLPSGRQVSFVDVPGHERYIKNMLAGIEAIDVALLVVAADEGWMPQSEEHLAVLDLLGVERGVVALTKVDRVDSDLVELATLEVMEHLEGTSLAGAPIMPVSAPAGQGVDEVAAALDAALTETEPGGDPRLWVDRRFTVAGAGTVVTGTLLGGPLAVGDTLEAYPGGEMLRIRSIESHEESHDRIDPHRRVALNLVGDSEAIERGTMLGRPGVWKATDRFTAHIRPARYVDELGEKGAYQVHAGSAAVPARLRLVEQGALLTLDRPLPLRYGDRFILRETGRRAVVGGGRILDPRPPARGRALRAAASLPSGLTPVDAADALLELRAMDTRSNLRAETGAEPETAISHGDILLTRIRLEDLTERATALIDEFHSTHPLRPGLPLATLASRLGVEAEVASMVVEDAPDLGGDGTVAWRAGWEVELGPGQQRAWEEARSLLAAAGLQAPRAAELPIDRELIHGLVRAGGLVMISEDLIYLPEEAEKLRSAVAAMPEGFTVADFRDRLGISRKYAVPILEWADDQGLTRRRGDTRSPVRD
ncbi:MAG TPA: selenocysteine-specific translation elongation factor [Acidimicrobiia bacterium]|nr:selenocysteine-specific translation elongation factor [Acidimicrobiia bacterium]